MYNIQNNNRQDSWSTDASQAGQFSDKDRHV